MLVLKPIHCNLDPESSFVVMLIQWNKMKKNEPISSKSSKQLDHPTMHTSELCIAVYTQYRSCEIIGTVYLSFHKLENCVRNEAVRTKLLFMVVLVLWIEP